MKNKPTPFHYLIIGYGETLHPEIDLVETAAQAKDSIVAMVFGKPENASEEQRANLLDGFDDEDHWGRSFDSTFDVTFEIGGVKVMKVYASPVIERATAAMASDPGKPFMFGIATPDGSAYIEENCVSPDAEGLNKEICGLNESLPGHRAVALFAHAVPAPLPDVAIKIEAAYHALRSYEFGNGSSELAKDAANGLLVLLSGARP